MSIEKVSTREPVSMWDKVCLTCGSRLIYSLQDNGPICKQCTDEINLMNALGIDDYKIPQRCHDPSQKIKEYPFSRRTCPICRSDTLVVTRKLGFIYCSKCLTYFFYLKDVNPPIEVFPFKLSDKQKIITRFKDFCKKKCLPEDYWDMVGEPNIYNAYIPVSFFSTSCYVEYSYPVSESKTVEKKRWEPEIRSSDGTILQYSGYRTYLDYETEEHIEYSNTRINDIKGRFIHYKEDTLSSISPELGDSENCRSLFEDFCERNLKNAKLKGERTLYDSSNSDIKSLPIFHLDLEKQRVWNESIVMIEKEIRMNFHSRSKLFDTDIQYSIDNIVYLPITIITMNYNGTLQMYIEAGFDETIHSDNMSFSFKTMINKCVKFFKRLIQ